MYSFSKRAVKISTAPRKAGFHSHNCLDSTNFKEVYDFLWKSEFPTEILSGSENEEERRLRRASRTKRCLPKALTGRQRPKQTIGAFIFGILKFFSNQQITANFSEREQMSTTFLREQISTTFLREQISTTFLPRAVKIKHKNTMKEQT